MDNARDIIISPLISEKTMKLMEENNAYTFKVAKKANKIQIRQAIEEIFNVKVVKVNTMNMKGKRKRLGFTEGKRPDWKKAIIRLDDGDSIEIFEGV
ncbi:50S ribosomal protein L23 [Halanaerobiaceae bacterium Z-7014]|uniref:Large ribosomal subunit protein uL23 n=1 Tax=Halonatronomonas betaini TaxID=2778430 RepID=A0A931FAV0_9FIRM|nr:50S ribosomal protein L23 [Halonatronomonas betaini]MBF8438014.1 50S ribosomal protein L23 [Halonatronomonas betaini]